jgi:chromosome segregation ATPase
MKKLFLSIFGMVFSLQSRSDKAIGMFHAAIEELEMVNAAAEEKCIKKLEKIAKLEAEHDDLEELKHKNFVVIGKLKAIVG